MKKNIKDVRFGRLIALNPLIDTIKFGQITWLCKCDCGNLHKVITKNLTSGKVRSCGCLQKETRSRIGKTLKHGKINTSEYRAWQTMKARCYNKNDKGYKNYGARGIKVCDKWLKGFENFYEDMGPKLDSKLSLDRINNDGNYEPENCRWATSSQQNKNKDCLNTMKYISQFIIGEIIQKNAEIYIIF